MDVIINQSLATIPEQVETIPSYQKVELNLLASCGYNMDQPPLADVYRSIHDLQGDWILLSPIYWEASHNDALIVSAEDGLPCSEEEFQQLFQWYSDFLAEESNTLYFHNPVTWLLNVNNKPPLYSKPLYQMLHQSMMPELSKLDTTMYWQKFFTECQMFFASTVNKTLINGVWFWGNGKLNAKLNLPICADAELFSLARAVSKNVSLYDPSVSLDKFRVLLLTQIDRITQTHKDELSKMPISWYWNNSAYKNKSSNWFSRLWRSWTHAY
ncbi:hypothetical protein [Legionella waltersii]|uniref:Cofactor-independent phosphoglycerate mutase n=1 Tax=Legionella waltersii TaxID=66969 RepID=A0A0W1AAV1_9GAMM|nr:hypothetical protein [Legionella waltersii]KTD78465.1 hypothetical protein Lwal_1900 [Legionella waltersii]SNV05909.1 Uncharacterized protein conserved in bacteria [Legionella waltersii]